jgi:hypothetical protein
MNLSLNDVELELAQLASIYSYEQEKLFQKDLDSAKELSLQDSSKTQCNLKDIADKSLTIMKVCYQQGADCFFHALKNGLYIYYWKKEIIDEKTCKEYLLSKDSKIFPLEYWRERVFRKFGINTNLDDQAGSYIATEILKLTRKDFTIIPYLFQAKEKSLILDEHLQKAVQEFRYLKNKTHIFILGNMRHDDSSGIMHGTEGHWICIVAHKENGRINYYGADSLSYPNINSYFEELFNLVENAPLS